MTPAGMTPEEGQWRLLGTGERLQVGDWGQNPATRAWEPVDPFLARERAKLGPASYNWLYCRRMDTEPDPAEPLREQLRQGWAILDRLYNLTAHILKKDERYPVRAWLGRNAGFGPEGGADVR